MLQYVIKLSLTLLMGTLLLACPLRADYSQEGELTEERGLDLDHGTLDRDSNHPRHLNLEDPAEWSASGEVMDKNHAWYRRRRSTQENKEGARSAVFIPPHIRIMKKKAYEQCRKKNEEFLAWQNNQPAPQLEMHCNQYCCFLVVIHSP